MSRGWFLARSSPAWAVAGLVVAIALKTTHGSADTFDLGLDDETLYLDGDRTYHTPIGQSLASNSPLYPAWYRLLSIVEPDLLRLYFTNWYVLTAAGPILLYALARRSGASLGGAAAISVAWSFSAAQSTWPFISKFVVLVLGLGALAATYPRERRTSAAILAVTLSLASYARPELSIFALVVAAAVVAWCFVQFVRPRARQRARRRWRPLVEGLAVAAIVGTLRAWFGISHDPSRAFFAFGQHYALNIVEQRLLAIDPWTHWYPIAKEAFPTATTVTEAVKENPGAFLWHVRTNVEELPMAILEFFRPLSWVPSPAREWITIAFDVALGCSVIGIFLRRRRTSRERVGRWLLLLLVVLGAGVTSVLVIYPRQHYVLTLCFFGVAALAALGGRFEGVVARVRPLRWFVGGARSGHAIVALLLVFFVFVPTFRASRAPTWPLLKPRETPIAASARENVRTIDHLRQLQLVGKLLILEADTSRGVYTTYPYERVSHTDKVGPFWDFVHARNVNVIVINDRLRYDTRFSGDPAFVAFDRGQGPLEDFVRFPIQGTNVVTCVRRTALPANRPAG